MKSSTPILTRISRRWLVGAGVVSAAAAYARITTGNSSLGRKSGPAGLTGNSTASGVENGVGAGQRPGLMPFKPVGQNLGSEQLEYYGQGFPFLDRAKMSRPWEGAGWNPPIDYAGGATTPEIPVNANGYPIAIPANAAGVQQVINIEGPYGPKDKQRYVFESTRIDATFEIPNQRIVSSKIVDGKRRIVFDATDPMPFPPSTGYGIYLLISKLPTPYALADTHQLFRIDQEAALKAGGIFTDEFIARVKDLGVFRFMDWDGTNQNSRENFADRPLPTHTTWHIVPLETQIALCNQANVPGYFCIMARASDDHVRELAAFIEARLKSDLRYLIEFTNEPWNYAFPAYHFLYTLTPAIPGEVGDPSNRQYGYRMARVAAIFRKASGYANRIDFCWGTMFVDATKTQANLLGIKRAIAEWSDPTHPNYDTEFAARFDTPGKLVNFLMTTGYVDGGLTYPATEGGRAAFKATIRNWAAATDDSGLAKAFRQIEFGDQLEGSSGTLNSFGAFLDVHRQIVEPLGIQLGQYEGGYHLDAAKSWPNGDPDQALITDFFTRLSYDERSYGIFMKLFTLTRSLGSQLFVHLCDQGAYNNPGGIWGAIRDGYHPDTPRARAIADFNAKPLAPLALNLSASTEGNFNVGVEPITTIVVTGGVGRIALTCSGLAPGRAFDGFRRIAGRLTATSTTTARIVARDEAGTTATLELPQVVKAALPTVKARSLRLVVTESAGNGRNFVVQLHEIRVRTAAGAIVPVTWTGPTSSGIYYKTELPAHLSDADVNSRWTSPSIAENRGQIELRGELAAITEIATIDFIPSDVGGAPGNFKLFVSDGNASRLVLAVNESDGTRWTARAARSFALAGPR